MESFFWIEEMDTMYRLGLSEVGRDELGDVHFVELLMDKQNLEVDELFISIEASKAVTDLTSPVSGKVLAWHEELENHPEYLNDDDREKNWIIQIKKLVNK